MALPSPAQLKKQLPCNDFVTIARKTAAAVLQREDPRLVCIVGPCSIHDPKAALEYAKRLKKLSAVVEHSLFIVMRVFCEKPRTRAGWKGMLYDPILDGSSNIADGLYLTRKLLFDLAELHLPCASEFLDPLAASYYEDLITWGFIGARTSASQPHRQMASRFSFPIGFKNTIFGQISPAINGVLAAQVSHAYLGIDESGKVSACQSQGNPLAHLVLRGSEEGPNFNEESVQRALYLLNEHSIETGIIIDCSHGNSGKDYSKQKIALSSLLEQVAQGTNKIAGFMIESHLREGHQPKSSTYGVSITDPCIGWEATEELLLKAASLNLSH